MRPGMERLRAVGTDASRAAPAEAEVSSTAFQELILFIYQGDCDRELQRALNLERLDAVADIRTRRTSIDEALSQIVVRATAWTWPPSSHYEAACRGTHLQTLDWLPRQLSQPQLFLLSHSCFEESGTGCFCAAASRLAAERPPLPVQAKKQERCAVDVSASFDDADAAAEGVRLRVEMQRAVDEERCGALVARLQPARRASGTLAPCNLKNLLAT